MENKIVILLKGFIIGGTMLVPGVSGGSMAMILGIYGNLISSVSNFFKDIKKNFSFLMLFSAGAFVGMMLFSKSILTLLTNYRIPVLYFFIGAVIGGIPVIAKACGVKRLDLSSLFYVLIGITMVMSLALIPEGLFNPSTINSVSGIAILFAAGFFAAIALVLPGISVSFVLLVLGIYEEIINAIDQFNIPYLLVVAVGLTIGIMLTTRLLEYAMNHHTRPTYLMILGFVLGSIVPIFPGPPTGVNIIICPLTLLAGAACIHLLSFLDR